jgi:hypothetical protein
MTKPIIFLDIDGVLNSQEFVDLLGDQWNMEQVDRKAVERLNRIVEATGAEVVISSTWRCCLPFETIRRIIDLAGGKVLIIDKTPVLGSPRGGEIQKWLDENPGHERFVILDDCEDMVHLWPHLVETTWDLGLLDEHVERAIKVINKGVEA